MVESNEVKLLKKHIRDLLAKLLGVRKYSDGSGYNFSQYATPINKD